MSWKRVDGSTYTQESVGEDNPWTKDMLMDTWQSASLQVTYSAAAGDTAFDNEAVVDEEITIPDHGYITGANVNYDVESGTTLDNLVDNTDYFVIRIDDDTIQLAATYADALTGTAIAVADGGTGEFTLTPMAIAGDVTAYGSNDGENWVVLSAPSPISVSAAGSTLWLDLPTSLRYLRVLSESDEGSVMDVVLKVNALADAQ